MDRWFGPALLAVLAPIARGLGALLGNRTGTAPGPIGEAKCCVFLKLKGGGSLIIALPALLALRRAAPYSTFILVCTAETKVYAELTGLFDRYSIITDRSLASVAWSGLKALKSALWPDIFIDLEPNSILASVFTILSLAPRRIGLVKFEEQYRAVSYTDALSWNLHAPVYVYYDQLAGLLGATPLPVADCREEVMKHIAKKARTSETMPSIGLAPFTSDYAGQRMMPVEVWVKLLQDYLDEKAVRFHIIGSAKNIIAADKFATQLAGDMPGSEVINICGQRSIAEVCADLLTMDEVWTVDSGLLHVTRLLGVKCRSFWGPTKPSQRLRPIPDLRETTVYNNFLCSPCAHSDSPPPCRGNNLCMKTIADANPDRMPIWNIGTG